jgi:ABC-2 type transport system ATP-binding protein
LALAIAHKPQVIFLDEPTVSAIIAFIESQKDPLIDLRVKRPSLEERFLEITGTGVVQ